LLPGKKPQSAALTLVTGNRGKRPVNENEPKPTGDVNKPAFVKSAAAKLWNQYAPSLEKQGILTAWDVDMFGAWCCLMAEFQKSPDRFTSSKLSQMRTLGESFGLLPCGRARLKTSGKEKADPADEFYGA
jgi:phage terminase small subunit